MVAFGEFDYEAPGLEPFRALMWHCRRCGAAAIEEIQPERWSAQAPAGIPTPAVTPPAATFGRGDVSDWRPESPRSAPTPTTNGGDDV